MNYLKAILLGALLMPMISKAQQQYMVTHYMFNGLGINPAYAGVHEGLSTSFVLREQWVGFEGAPSTQAVSIHSPIRNRPVSMGAVLYRDKLGLSTEYGGQFSFAYRLQISRDVQLSMGLQGSTHNYTVDYTIANLGINDNEGLGRISEMAWNVGAGLMVHSERAYLGVSSPQLINTRLDIGNPDQTFSDLVRHYYVTAGYAFNLGFNYTLKPNVLLKAVQGAPVQVDINANLLIKSVVWLGASYRSLDSLDGLIGLQVNPQLMISYATDFTLSEVEAQSHEIMLNYIFELPTRKILSPRYF
ncbi:MAG: type IX secretion system membrane protein PorP/SprF [Ekhidna sp.]|nr:type IX secretion system membrane protein PorP/SprF [Ekhidna sp.]